MSKVSIIEQSAEKASYAATAAARVLHRHVSEGEIQDVLAMLPDELRAVAGG